jgi:hypothetical protein
LEELLAAKPLSGLAAPPSDQSPRNQSGKFFTFAIEIAGLHRVTSDSGSPSRFISVACSCFSEFGLNAVFSHPTHLHAGTE